MKTPEYLDDAILLYQAKGSLFWTQEESTSSDQALSNVLSDMYYANRRRTTTNNVRRAFYCVALYRVIQRIMQLHGSKYFTSNIALFCAGMILRDAGSENSWTEVDIIKDLKSDYNIGGVYEPYAQKEGSGIFFYLFVLPSDL